MQVAYTDTRYEWCSVYSSFEMKCRSSRSTPLYVSRSSPSWAFLRSYSVPMK